MSKFKLPSKAYCDSCERKRKVVISPSDIEVKTSTIEDNVITGTFAVFIDCEECSEQVGEIIFDSELTIPEDATVEFAYEEDE
jgi:hypothetical protein